MEVAIKTRVKITKDKKVMELTEEEAKELYYKLHEKYGTHFWYYWTPPWTPNYTVTTTASTT